MAKKSTTTVTYKTKLVNGKLHMACQNSSTDSKYFTGNACENYVPVSNKDVVSVLCSSCTSTMCSTPQTKKRKVAAPARKKTVTKSTKTTVARTKSTVTDPTAPKRKAGRPKKVVA